MDLKRMAKRKRTGKESEVFVDGVQIPPAKIIKSKYRKGYVPMILQHDIDSPPLSLFVDLSRHGNAITKGANFELMQRLSSIVPWKKLHHSPNFHGGSRTSATLSILMPEMEQGQHDVLSTNLSILKSGLRDHLSVVLYLISNNLTSRDPDDLLVEKLERDDELILKLLKDTGWDDLRHLKVLLSTREPTAESIIEKLLVEVVNKDGEAFLPPLQFAAHEEGSVRLINLLIKYGADVNFSINGNGETALYFAINERNNPAVRALLLQGATVTWRCARLAAAVKSAEKLEFSLIEDSPVEDMIDLYLEQDLNTERDDPEILVPAVEMGNMRVTELFLARAARVNGMTSQFLSKERASSRTT
ncbi:ankyrin [Penicillium pulvis]|uniref:ankyrin n=1 Tax=Penicillium pulvis TaxID=1562058 RepID=UPI002548361D|nr:ankyrin [Penicillium pulvis]KAJ5802326.1 ankyrin [Penicillium pulvis]